MCVEDGHTLVSQARPNQPQRRSLSVSPCMILKAIRTGVGWVWLVRLGHTCVYTKFTFRLHHTRHSCSIFTALWCGWSFVKLTFYIFTTPPSWIWPLGTTVQIMLGLHHIVDTRQVREYPDSTISKVLTVLKWWTITMFNRKLLEKQRAQNRFASYEVHIGHCQFWKSFNSVYIQISKFSLD